MKSIKTMILGIALILLGIWSYSFGSYAYGVYGYVCQLISVFSPIIGIVVVISGFYTKDKQQDQSMWCWNGNETLPFDIEEGKTWIVSECY